MVNNIKNAVLIAFIITYSSIRYVVNFIAGFISEAINQIFFPDLIDKHNRENKEE